MPRCELALGVDGDVPVLARDAVGRVRGPDLVDDLHRLDHHLRAVLVACLEQLEVRAEPARAHAHDVAALAQVVEQRHVAGDLGRVVLRQVDDAGGEGDRLRLVDQRRHELERVGDRLGRAGVVLADPGLVVAEPVREQDRLAVVPQHVAVGPPRIVQRHHEQAELHPLPLICRTSRSRQRLARRPPHDSPPAAGLGHAKGARSTGGSPERSSAASANPEPQASVQPRGPWPVLR